MSFNAHRKGENLEKSAIYQDWLLTPREMRQPTSQRLLAEELEVTEQTLRNWRKEPRFQRDLTEKARGLVKAEKLPDIIEALYATAIGQTPQQVAAAKVLMDFMERTLPTSGLDMSTLTPDQLRDLGTAALKALANESPA